MQDAPPAEAQGRPVGHFCDRLDRLGTNEESERPRRRAAKRPLSKPFAARPRFSERRGRGRLGLFGQMRLDKLAPRHRARPEPRAQAVDEIGERAGAIGLVRPVELDLRGRERLGRKA